MKRIFFIHGWGGYPNEGWRPWLKKELQKKEYQVINKQMPNSKNPKMKNWVNTLDKLVKLPDQNCYFVGHSLGCITILRYLEKLKKNEKIGGVILVAGFTSNLGIDEVDTFFKQKINYKKIKSHCKNFIAIHSDNDPYVSLHYGNIFKEKLNAKLFVEHNMKHFSGDDGIKKLPIVFKKVLEISN